MKGQDVLNAISTLSGVVDALNRAGDKESIKIITLKILELVSKIK